MQRKTLSVSDLIRSHCTQCRKKTEHIIVTMAAEGPGKVLCKTCNKQQKYRPIPTTKKSVLDRRDAERKEWAALRPDMNRAEARDYSMSDGYKVKTLINHHVFGLGLVRKVIGSQKIEVLFEDGNKIMRCK